MVNSPPLKINSRPSFRRSEVCSGRSTYKVRQLGHKIARRHGGCLIPTGMGIIRMQKSVAKFKTSMLMRKTWASGKHIATGSKPPKSARQTDGPDTHDLGPDRPARGG